MSSGMYLEVKVTPPMPTQLAIGRVKALCICNLKIRWW